MRYLYRSKLGSTLVAMALFAGGTHSAFAVGTESGVPITNTASVDYTVGTFTGTETSNTDSFVVDSKVDLTVALVSGATVVPGSTKQTLVYSVSNLGNTDQSYALAATPTAGTDDFDTTSVAIYNDDGAVSGVWDVTNTLYVDGAATIAHDTASTFQVLVVSDVPSTVTNGQTAIYDLTATTLDAGTTTVTAATPGADVDTLQVLFADAAGTTDGLRDGAHSAAATYTVATAALAVAKDSTVISDPFNATTNPQAIPGAVVEYGITVTNSGGAATNVIITDPVPTNTTYVTGSVVVSAGGTVAYSDDGTTFVATETTPVTHVRVTFPTLADGTTTPTEATMTFQVTIN